MNTLSYYESNAKSLAIRYESANVENIHKLLLKIFTPNQHLLEIGCGSGRDASFMHQNGYNIVAIDGSDKMIAEAKILHPEIKTNLYVKKIPNDLDFETQCFDGIYSIATLMHLEQKDIDATIEKIYNTLKPKGKFLFSVSIQRDDVDDNGKDEYGRHFTAMSQEQWIITCKNRGFRVIETEMSGDGLDRDGIVWFTCILNKL